MNDMSDTQDAAREAMEYIQSFGRTLNDYRGRCGRDATRGVQLPGWPDDDALPGTMRWKAGFGGALDTLDSVIAKARRARGDNWLTDALASMDQAERELCRAEETWEAALRTVADERDAIRDDLSAACDLLRTQMNYGGCPNPKQIATFLANVETETPKGE